MKALKEAMQKLGAKVATHQPANRYVKLLRKPWWTENTDKQSADNMSVTIPEIRDGSHGAEYFQNITRRHDGSSYSGRAELSMRLQSEQYGVHWKRGQLDGAYTYMEMTHPNPKCSSIEVRCEEGYTTDKGNVSAKEVWLTLPLDQAEVVIAYLQACIDQHQQHGENKT